MPTTDLLHTLGHIEHTLDAEYRDRLSDQTLHGLAVDAVARFDNARVRNFIPILALRVARDRADVLVDA